MLENRGDISTHPDRHSLDWWGVAKLESCVDSQKIHHYDKE